MFLILISILIIFFENDDMEDDYLDYINILIRRKHKDHVLDNNGKKLLSLCKSTNHIIANSRLLQGIEGNCTFCSQRGLSVTDDLLLNMNDINMLHNFEILNWTHFSDHAALSFSLRRNCIETNEFKQQEQVIYETKITIDEQKNKNLKDT